MKKRIIAILILAIVLCVIFAACKKNNEKMADEFFEKMNSAQASYTLRFSTNESNECEIKVQDKTMHMVYIHAMGVSVESYTDGVKTYTRNGNSSFESDTEFLKVSTVTALLKRTDYTVNGNEIIFADTQDLLHKIVLAATSSARVEYVYFPNTENESVDIIEIININLTVVNTPSWVN